MPNGHRHNYLFSNHVHVITHADAREPASAMMQLAAGWTAGQYNQRKGRRGDFWDERFRCTAVESGKHLWNCLAYVDIKSLLCLISPAQRTPGLPASFSSYGL